MHCMVRVNDLNTFRLERNIYLVGRGEVVNRGVRGYFENNLGVAGLSLHKLRGPT
jgi:hypothetical protein